MQLYPKKQDYTEYPFWDMPEVNDLSFENRAVVQDYLSEKIEIFVERIKQEEDKTTIEKACVFAAHAIKMRYRLIFEYDYMTLQDVQFMYHVK